MLLVIYNRPGFTGERIKNPDSYSLDILRMNGTDSHTLSLNAGDVLQVEFETSKGSLHIKITARTARSFMPETARKPRALKSISRKPALTPLPCRRGMPKVESTFGSKHRDPGLHEPLNSNKSEMAL